MGGPTLTEFDTEIEQTLRPAIRAEVQPMLDDFRRFVDRRIAELSMEVSAAVQLVDYSETNLSGQLSRIHEQIVNVVAAPAAATRNSGVELEAVVQATEAAANKIMGAAEAIGDWLRDGRRDPESLEQVAEKVNAIFEACTFQDVTGQRIRRAIEHLQQVETMLVGIIPEAPQEARPEPEAPAPDPAQNPDLMQDAVDAMFD
jgi:chemotaxis protein CheZ